MPITKLYARKQDYLGTMLDYSLLGEVKITMTDYIKLILQDTPDNMQGKVAVTPAGNLLFLINESNPELLDGEKCDNFVHIVI